MKKCICWYLSIIILLCVISTDNRKETHLSSKVTFTSEYSEFYNRVIQLNGKILPMADRYE